MHFVNKKNSARIMVLFYVFANSFNVWLTRRLPNSHTCSYIQSVVNQMSCILENPTVHYERMRVRKTDNNLML